jgi:methyl-accepting chemotaxis protein
MILRRVKLATRLFAIIVLALAAAAGGGFVEYVFEKPGQGVQPKVSYAQAIPGTDFWVGTGVYADNVAVREPTPGGMLTDQPASSTVPPVRALS